MPVVRPLAFREAGKRQDAGRALISRCASRSGCTTRPRPAAGATGALEALITLRANCPRSASDTTNTETMLAVCTRLPSYARLPRLTLKPHAPLRPSSTTLPLDANRARQARCALLSNHGLDDDLNRPRRQPSGPWIPRYALDTLWPVWACLVVVRGLLDADVGNASGEDCYE